jgi:hypothetical protein
MAPEIGADNPPTDPSSAQNGDRCGQSKLQDYAMHGSKSLPFAVPPISDRERIGGCHRAYAQTARIRADLRLTPDQEKNWPGFESAMRDIGKARADRENTTREDRAQQKGPVDIIDRMHREADYMSERSADQKKLADAAQPLFASLDDQQKRRFSENLIRINNERDPK